jgi:hypothetical protein
VGQCALHCVALYGSRAAMWGIVSANVRQRGRAAISHHVSSISERGAGGGMPSVLATAQ